MGDDNFFVIAGIIAAVAAFILMKSFNVPSDVGGIQMGNFAGLWFVLFFIIVAISSLFEPKNKE